MSRTAVIYYTLDRLPCPYLGVKKMKKAEKAEFEVGDKVYCPNANTKISIVREFGQVLALTFGKSHIPFDEYGVSTITQIPTVFHATPENHALLEKLYGVKFEAPPAPKNPKEIIQAMLDDGWHSVLCLCYDFPDQSECNLNSCIREVRENDYFIDINNERWEFATPFDPKTGKTIVDYIDGKIVTE